MELLELYQKHEYGLKYDRAERTFIKEESEKAGIPFSPRGKMCRECYFEQVLLLLKNRQKDVCEPNDQNGGYILGSAYRNGFEVRGQRFCQIGMTREQGDYLLSIGLGGIFEHIPQKESSNDNEEKSEKGE